MYFGKSFLAWPFGKVRFFVDKYSNSPPSSVGEVSLFLLLSHALQTNPWTPGAAFGAHLCSFLSSVLTLRPFGDGMQLTSGVSLREVNVFLSKLPREFSITIRDNWIVPGSPWCKRTISSMKSQANCVAWIVVFTGPSVPEKSIGRAQPTSSHARCSQGKLNGKIIVLCHASCIQMKPSLSQHTCLPHYHCVHNPCNLICIPTLPSLSHCSRQAHLEAVSILDWGDPRWT